MTVRELHEWILAEALSVMCLHIGGERIALHDDIFRVPRSIWIRFDPCQMLDLLLYLHVSNLDESDDAVRIKERYAH